MLLGLADKYAGADVAKALRDRNDLFDAEASADTGGVADLDDFSRCRITKKQDIKDLFVPHFYFGCEADDPINAWAFNRKTNPFDARLNTLFGSDIGHFDVPDMADVVPEAHELLEDGLISADDFRDFTFANAVRFWATANPNIFKGTVVEGAAAALSAETPGKG
jgi:hypothetical protein